MIALCYITESFGKKRREKDEQAEQEPSATLKASGDGKYSLQILLRRSEHKRSIRGVAAKATQKHGCSPSYLANERLIN